MSGPPSSSSASSESSASAKNASILLPKLEYLPESSNSNTIKAQLERSQLSSNTSGGYLQPPSPAAVAAAAAAVETQNYGGFYEEHTQNKGNMEKIKKLVKYNPFVPIGALVTIGILFNGIIAMKNKDRVKSQRMMRYRVAAQGTTILALVAGTLATQLFYQVRD